MVPLILIILVLGAAWLFSGLLVSAVQKFYHSYPLKEFDFPDALLSGMLICPYCKDLIQVDEAIVSCNDCGTLHHYECWNHTESCSVFGCDGTQEKLL